jgi:anti-sigma28 factor (negative regulator of flagellin synthesis)
MKIGRRDDGQDAVTITRRTETDPSAANKTEAREKPGVRHAYAFGHGETDKVNLRLKDTIEAALQSGDDTAIRRKRIEELKKLVQSGQYNPPVEDVARKLGEEITFEILLKPGETGEDELIG